MKTNNIKSPSISWLEPKIKEMQSKSLANPIAQSQFEKAEGDFMDRVYTEQAGFYRATLCVIIPAPWTADLIMNLAEPCWIACSEFLIPDPERPASISECSPKIQHKLFLMCAALLERVGIGPADRGGALASKEGWVIYPKHVQYTKRLTPEEIETIQGQKAERAGEPIEEPGEEKTLDVSPIVVDYQR